VRIMFINNDGGGFADYIGRRQWHHRRSTVPRRVPYSKPEDYLIRVNRQHVTAGQVLQENDRVSCTPIKLQGAV